MRYKEGYSKVIGDANSKKIDTKSYCRYVLSEILCLRHPRRTQKNRKHEAGMSFKLIRDKFVVVIRR